MTDQTDPDTPAGLTPADVDLREEIAHGLGSSPFPADKQALIESADRNGAPGEVLGQLSRLPEGEYATMDDVADALGLGV